MGTRSEIQIFGVDSKEYQMHEIMASAEIFQHFNRYSGSGRLELDLGHTRGTNKDWMAQAMLISKNGKSERTFYHHPLDQ